MTICAHFSNIYIRTFRYIIAICRFWTSAVKDIKNWLEVFINSVRKDLFARKSNGPT